MASSLLNSETTRGTHFQFGTKASTLARLRAYEFGALLCDQEVFDCAAWCKDNKTISTRVSRIFAGKRLVVRSSSRMEDTLTASMAGAFTSIVGVDCDPKAIAHAVETVIESYGADRTDSDEVLIQPLVENVSVSGVVFSADIATGAPYIVINYDDFSGRTDTVTGGAESKLMYVRRQGENSVRSPRFRKLIDAVYELEKITGSTAVDIEFCIDDTDRIFILQVRPLTVPNLLDANDRGHFHAQLAALESKIEKVMPAPAGILGRRTVLGEMPDWNPSEIIGRTPTPLAASLYDHLITHRAWSDARAEMGYRAVNRPLMLMLEGHPFIDVRLSLNSFLPATLSDDLVCRIVDEQIEYLERHVDLHDKLEFDVAITAWDFDLADRLERLALAGLSNDEVAEIEAAIKQHTLSLIERGVAGVDIILRRVDRLVDLLRDTPGTSPLDAAFGVLDETRLSGTVPFSILARHAFIAVAILKSLVARGVLSETRYNEFLTSVSTVTTEFVNDGVDFAAGELSRERYLERYGHLRPGTYDIRIASYAEAPDRYLATEVTKKVQHPPFILDSAECDAIQSLFEQHAFPFDVDQFLAYARSAIAGREKAKFEFTRGICRAFDHFLEWGNARALSRDDIAFLTLEDMRGALSQGELTDRIEMSRALMAESRRIRLPSLITSPGDCDVVRVPLGKPTFVSSLRISGSVTMLSSETRDVDIEGKIVAIESADPGFDWIFSHHLLGLITKYGGANSHMAIRCAEFGLPAAIGCGERTFDAAVAAGHIELDCAGDTIRYH